MPYNHNNREYDSLADMVVGGLIDELGPAGLLAGGHSHLNRMRVWNLLRPPHDDDDEPYDTVHVLLMHWDRAERLPYVEAEVAELSGIFTNTFRYNVEVYRIPSSIDVQSKTLSKVRDLVNKDKGKRCLRILYYGGHGQVIGRRSPQLFIESGASANPKRDHLVEWDSVYNVLEECANIDKVLVIMDCCNAAYIQPRREARVAIQLLAASPYDRLASAGERSFTKILCEQLLLLAREHEDEGVFHAGELFYSVNSRMQSHRLNAPIQHFLVPPGTGKYTPARFYLPPPPDRQTATNPSETERSVLISVRMIEDATDERSIKKLVDDIENDLKKLSTGKVTYELSAVYESGSCLLIFNIPLRIWASVGPQAAIQEIGWVRSTNLLRDVDFQDDEDEEGADKETQGGTCEKRYRGTVLVAIWFEDTCWDIDVIKKIRSYIKRFSSDVTKCDIGAAYLDAYGGFFLLANIPQWLLDSWKYSMKGLRLHFVNLVWSTNLLPKLLRQEDKNKNIEQEEAAKEAVEKDKNGNNNQHN